MEEAASLPATIPTSVHLYVAVGISIPVIVLNLWLLITIGETRTLWTTSNMYVTSLAVTDLLVGVDIWLYTLAIVPEYEAWLYGNAYACNILGAIDLTVSHATIVTSMLVAIDRYVYIAHPNFYRREVTTRRVLASLILGWGVSFGLTVPMPHLKAHDGRIPQCSVELPIEADIYMFGTLFCVCTAVTGTMYALISRIALQHQAAVAPLRTLALGRPRPPMWDAVQQKLRGIKMFLAVFGAYIFCWTPYVVVLFVHHLNTPLPPVIPQAAYLLGMFNSVLNVPVFLLLNSSIRKAFRETCCCCCSSCARGDTSQSDPTESVDNSAGLEMVSVE
nr:hypothetical protein BaRGS_003535 [Batillaria attramentaria]